MTLFTMAALGRPLPLEEFPGMREIAETAERMAAGAAATGRAALGGVTLRAATNVAPDSVREFETKRGAPIPASLAVPEGILKLGAARRVLNSRTESGATFDATRRVTLPRGPAPDGHAVTGSAGRLEFRHID